MLAKDRMLSIAVLLLLGVMYVETFQFPEKSDWQLFSTTFYPRILLTVTGILALLLLIRSFKHEKGKETPKVEWKQMGKKYGKVMALFATTGIYVWILPHLGFLPATLFYLFSSQAILMGTKSPKGILLNVTVTFSATFLVFYLFQHVLNIWLP